MLVVLAILAVIAWRVRRLLADRRAVQPGAS
jgi:flagellar biogenesis protein FliO